MHILRGNEENIREGFELQSKGRMSKGETKIKMGETAEERCHMKGSKTVGRN
jgi:hypothetical protein